MTPPKTGSGVFDNPTESPLPWALTGLAIAVIITSGYGLTMMARKQ